MPSSLPPERHVPGRRALLAAGLGSVAAALAPLRSGAAQEAEAAALLRQGGVVAAFRHAHAPGTFDPPGFRLGDCGTQRNLSEAGRAQARGIGQWFAQRALQPARVLSSPWCRCVDTATLSFAPPQVWPALGSPHGVPDTGRTAQLRELRAALATASARRGVFEAWFTHMFVLADLTGVNASSGECLVLRAGAGGQAQVLARLALPA